MLKQEQLNALKQIARGLAQQFGKNCEVVIHEVSERSASGSILAIENGHVTGRSIGDGPSHVVLEQLGHDHADPADHIGYLTRTPDGKILKSSSIFIRDEAGKVCAIFGVNYDVSALSMAQTALQELYMPNEPTTAPPEQIPLKVSQLLDDLIRQADQLIGKPPALMNKEEKIRAVQFLDHNGAMLITKSGDKIARHFGISKYTLYSYLDHKKTEESGR